MIPCNLPDEAEQESEALWSMQNGVLLATRLSARDRIFYAARTILTYGFSTALRGD
jgi:hypothetical protein